jgi:hypothetical protein
MKITFTPAGEIAENVINPPVPAKSVIPEWYKKAPTTNLKNPEIYKNDNSYIMDKTIKSCMPFLDALTGGYIQKTWTDIFVAQKEGQLVYYSATPPMIMNNREKVSIEIDSNVYYSVEYVWQSYWRAKLPKGYSLLITHPLNRLDLPFTTLSAIVDADSFNHTAVGNIPFFIRNGFQGFIPVGTPMYQMIPIKRDTWEQEIEPFNEREAFKKEHLMRSRFYNAYRDMFWQKKHYN